MSRQPPLIVSTPILPPNADRTIRVSKHRPVLRRDSRVALRERHPGRSYDNHSAPTSVEARSPSSVTAPAASLARTRLACRTLRHFFRELRHSCPGLRQPSRSSTLPPRRSSNMPVGTSVGSETVWESSAAAPFSTGRSLPGSVIAPGRPLSAPFSHGSRRVSRPWVAMDRRPG